MPSNGLNKILNKNIYTPIISIMEEHRNEIIKFFRLSEYRRADKKI